MKKLLALLLIFVCLVLSSSFLWAAEGRIEISFKVGDDILTINGKETQVEKPVVINGVTLVPLRVISEAFGAEVQWDGALRRVTLSYNGILINLYIDNKEAMVDNTKTELLEAPKIINDKTMVPLRFITENFGADVSYDEKTQQITVIKESANENSIKDFSLILKKTSKGRVGDSYYKWSIDYPKTLKLSQRSFNGSWNIFVHQDETYFIALSIEDNEDQSLDSILPAVLNRVKEYTLINQQKLKAGQDEYIKVVYRDKKSGYEERYYIKDNKIYSLGLFYDDYNKYKEDKEIQKILDSFMLEYKNDGTEEDLSDVTSDGMRPYEDKKFGYSLKVLADWVEIKSEDKENKITFSDGSKNLVYIYVHSIEKGQALEEIVKKELEYLYREYNQEVYKLQSSESGLIGGKVVKKMNFVVKLGNDTVYSTDIYAVGKNYKYNFGFVLDAETYNDSEKRAKIMSMLESFKFEEPDFDELGYILDPNLIDTAETFKTVENKDMGLSFTIPATWSENKDFNTSKSIQYHNNEGFMSVTVLASPDISYEDYIPEFIENIKKSAAINSNISLDSEEDIEVKGMKAKKYTTSLKVGNNVIKELGYILNKDGKVVLVSMSITDLRKSDKNVKILNDIWESMKFE